MSKRAPEEVADLKAQWSDDPCWDLEDTEGFEAHREELAAYSAAMHRQWHKEERYRIGERAKRLMCSEKLVEYIERLEARIAKLEVRDHD